MVFEDCVSSSFASWTSDLFSYKQKRPMLYDHFVVGDIVEYPQKRGSGASFKEVQRWLGCLYR